MRAPDHAPGALLLLGLALVVAAALTPAGLSAARSRRGRGRCGRGLRGCALDFQTRRLPLAEAFRRAGWLVPVVALFSVPAALLAPAGSRLAVAPRSPRAPLSAAAMGAAVATRLGPSGLVRAAGTAASGSPVDVFEAMLASLTIVLRQVRAMLRAREARRPAFGRSATSPRAPSKPRAASGVLRRRCCCVARTRGSDRAARRAGRRAVTHDGGAGVGFDVTGLTYHYPDGSPALDGVTLSVAAGERVGSSGPTARASHAAAAPRRLLPSGAATCTRTNGRARASPRPRGQHRHWRHARGAGDHRPHPRSRGHRVPGSRRPVDRPHVGEDVGYGRARATGLRRGRRRSARGLHSVRLEATNTARRITVDRRETTRLPGWRAGLRTGPAAARRALVGARSARQAQPGRPARQPGRDHHRREPRSRLHPEGRSRIIVLDGGL